MATTLNNTMICTVSSLSKELCAIASIEDAYRCVKIYDLAHPTSPGSLKFTLLDRTALQQTVLEKQKCVGMEFSCDNTYLLVATSTNTIYVWDLRRAVLAHTLPTIDTSTSMLDISTSATKGNVFYILSPSKEGKVVVLEYHISSSDIKLTKKIKTGASFVVGEGDGDDESSKNGACLQVFASSSTSSDVAMIQVSSDNKIRFVDLQNGSRLAKLSVADEDVNGMMLSQSTKAYIGVVDHDKIHIYRNPSAEEEEQESSANGPVATIHVTALASAVEEGSSQVKHVELLENTSASSLTVLVTTNDGSVALHDVTIPEAQGVVVEEDEEEGSSSKKSKKHKKKKKRKSTASGSNTVVVSSAPNGIVKLVLDDDAASASDQYQILYCMFSMSSKHQLICIVRNNNTDDILVRKLKYRSVQDNDTSSTINKEIILNLSTDKTTTTTTTTINSTVEVSSRKRPATSTSDNVLLGPGDDALTHGSNLQITDLESTTDKKKKKKSKTNEEDDTFWDLDDDKNEPSIKAETIAERMEALTSIHRANDDDDEILDDDDIDVKDKLEATSSTNLVAANTSTNPEGLGVLLKQALEGNDEIQLEEVLRCHNPKIVQQTLESIEELDLIVSLLLKLCHRISQKPSRAQYLATVWIKSLVEIHHDMLLEANYEGHINLGHVLGPLVGLLQDRTSNYQSLLKLDGRLRMLQRQQQHHQQQYRQH